MWKSGAYLYPSSPLGQKQQPFDSQQQHSQMITVPPERNFSYPAQSNGEWGMCTAWHNSTRDVLCSELQKKSRNVFNPQKSCTRHTGLWFYCLLKSYTDLSQQQARTYLRNKPPLPSITSSSCDNLYKIYIFSSSQHQKGHSPSPCLSICSSKHGWC